MRQVLNHIKIIELVVHDIPPKLSRRILRQTPEVEEDQPMYSQIPSTIDQQIVRFFHDKITSSIGSTDSIDIVFNEAHQSPVKSLVEEYLTCETNRRISITQDIAKHLYDIQNAQNSGGLLLFVCCECNTERVLAILKVEREEGVRVKQQTMTNGLMTLDIDYITDLMLTKKTKLFKIVLFFRAQELVKGILCDKQRGYSSKEVADFFLCDFLGCNLTEEPQILTKRFFEATQSFINTRLTSSLEKGELLSHLLSELLDQRPTLNPSEFARRTLPPELRDEFIGFLQENSSPVNAFPKVISLVENKLRQVQYDFISGLKVVGSQEVIDTVATVSDVENGKTKIEIIDILQQVKSK